MRPYLSAPEKVVVPTLVQYEIARLVLRERGDQAAMEAVAATNLCQVMPVTTEITLLAARLSTEHKLPMADAIILATARDRACVLVSLDAHFEGIDGVVYLPKKG